MRERMDFSSISKIILDNRKADCLSNTEYYLTLFEFAFTQLEIVIVEFSIQKRMVFVFLIFWWTTDFLR